MQSTHHKGPSSGVVFLQKVHKGKIALSRKFRREMTPAERALWEELRGSRLAGLKFRRQQIIEGFIADFFCHAKKLVVEVDGGIHSTAEQRKIDEHRRNVFEARGLREIRFKNEEVLCDIENVKKRILAVCF